MDAWTYDKIDEAIKILDEISHSLKRLADYYTPTEKADTPQMDRQQLEGKRWTDVLTTTEKKCMLDALDFTDTPQTDCGWGEPNE